MGLVLLLWLLFLSPLLFVVVICLFFGFILWRSFVLLPLSISLGYSKPSRCPSSFVNKCQVICNNATATTVPTGRKCSWHSKQSEKTTPTDISVVSESTVKIHYVSDITFSIAPSNCLEAQTLPRNSLRILSHSMHLSVMLQICLFGYIRIA